MKQTKKGFVQMPVQTLNALKNMLFSNEGGVDLSNIINDITLSEEHRDLTAINVALVHKGISIDIDTTTRYDLSWGKNIKMYEYVGHSLILGIVKMQVYDCHLNDENNLVVDRVHPEIEVHGFDQWAQLSTELSEVIAKIQPK